MLALLALVFSLKIYPLVSFAPATLRLTVTAEPTELSRSLRVELDGGEFFRSSTIPMDGEHAPKTSKFEWREVPGGEYQVTAWLLGTSDTILQKAIQQVMVQ